ncbi:triose-phosphate isomerase [Metamycoplasma hyosynoviae]|uniref:triose-phosphate isomerase n=1 Tax=Metamycoplasma hyosynoviae TaxID=29559 RepID=UPI00236736DA|nr:triose-phosphate isomerase family protein [Metamycoplasma hyosynoviae]MDD7838021.1 triose-phosphate isomerase [Metamycoplasma hyosynoviae]
MKYFIANLKSELSYLETKKYLTDIASYIPKTTLDLASTYIGLAVMSSALPFALDYFSNNTFKIGAQNVSSYNKGCMVDETTVTSLKEMQVKFAIVGHSYVRKSKCESNELINSQILLLQESNILPILCIGESAQDCNSKDRLMKFLTKEIEECTKNVDLKSLIIAYEPISYIGTGKIPKIMYLEDAINFIKQKTNHQVPVLYGGSVCDNTISSLLEVKNLDGFLIGYYSINPQNFIDLINKTNCK